MHDNQLMRERGDTTTKRLVLKYLEELSDLYKETLIGIQVAKWESKRDAQLVMNFHSYTSGIVALYRVMKPKLRLIDGNKYDELRELDKYMLLLDSINSNLDTDDTFLLFNIFNLWEDQLRELAEELGYTRDAIGE